MDNANTGKLKRQNISSFVKSEVLAETVFVRIFIILFYLEYFLSSFAACLLVNGIGKEELIESTFFESGFLSNRFCINLSPCIFM